MAAEIAFLSEPGAKSLASHQFQIPDRRMDAGTALTGVAWMAARASARAAAHRRRSDGSRHGAPGIADITIAGAPNQLSLL